MLEWIGVLENLGSIFSVERLSARRRRRVAKALVSLYGSLELVLANARLILENEPDDAGFVDTDPRLLELQVGALAETQRLLSTPPLGPLLRIKWKQATRLRQISDGKGHALGLALAAFYGCLPEEQAGAAILEAFAPGLWQQELKDPEDAFEGQVSLAAGFLEAKEDGVRIVVYATAAQYREAVTRVAELAELTERLREFIADEFTYEDLT